MLLLLATTIDLAALKLRIPKIHHIVLPQSSASTFERSQFKCTRVASESDRTTARHWHFLKALEVPDFCLLKMLLLNNGGFLRIWDSLRTLPVLWDNVSTTVDSNAEV